MTNDQDDILFYIHENLEVTPAEIRWYMGASNIMKIFRLIWDITVLLRDKKIIKVQRHNSIAYRLNPDYQGELDKKYS